MSPRSRRLLRGFGLTSPLVFCVLAVFEAVIAPGDWLHNAVYVVFDPATIAIATGLYLDLPKRSSAATTLLVLAGVGAVVIQGSAHVLPLLAIIAIALLGAAVSAYAARSSRGAVPRNERGPLNRASI
jgi:hypothetical protein